MKFGEIVQPWLARKEANPGKSSKDYTPADWAKVHNIITGAIEPEAPAAQPEPEPDEFTDEYPF